MKAILFTLIRDDQGQDLIEYGLLAAFISIVAVAAITAIGTNLSALYTTINGPVTAANAS
jgi:pilus assembly protein Flp/PilA